MNEFQQIKSKLINEDKVEELLKHIGCEHIKYEQRGYLITAQLPQKFQSMNKRSVQVRLNKSMSCFIRSRADFKGDIFNLISYIHHDKSADELQDDLSNAKRFICNIFGWNQFLQGGKRDIVVKDYTASLKEIIGDKYHKEKIKPNPILPEETLNQFYYRGKPLPFQDWIDEGISHRTQMFYNIGFCLESKRVTIPLRNRFGKLVGVKGRIMKDEDDLDSKYIYLYKCQNRYEWFNFYLAHPHILINKRVYIFEAEKSCMKAHSHRIFNTLGIGSSDISKEQADMVKKLGLDIEIVLCYDKDKTTDEIREQAEIFKGRKVYGMFDVDNLLGEKDSPIDCGIEVWNKLIENNIYEINL